MESSKIGYWLQVFANIGILVGLILVGMQISQASFLVQNQLVSDQFAMRMASMENTLGEDPANTISKAFTNPEDLTDAEILIMDSWMIREVTYAKRVIRLTDSGVFSAEAWEDHKEVLDYAFSSDFARSWWKLSRRQFVETD